MSSPSTLIPNLNLGWYRHLASVRTVSSLLIVLFIISFCLAWPWKWNSIVILNSLFALHFLMLGLRTVVAHRDCLSIELLPQQIFFEFRRYPLSFSTDRIQRCILQLKTGLSDDYTDLPPAIQVEFILRDYPTQRLEIAKEHLPTLQAWLEENRVQTEQHLPLWIGRGNDLLP